jgi:hypothetical protein
VARRSFTSTYRVPRCMFYRGACSTEVHVLPRCMFYRGACSTEVHVLPRCMCRACAEHVQSMCRACAEHVSRSRAEGCERQGPPSRVRAKGQ